MKAAFVAWGNPLDIHFASGTPYHILKMLKNSSLDTRVVPVDGIVNQAPEQSMAEWEGEAFRSNSIAGWAKLRFKEACYNKLTSKTYMRGFDPLLMAWRAGLVEKQLAKTAHDLVFTWSNHVTPYLKTDRPLVFWNDYTFAGYMDIYPPFAGLCRETINHGHRAEELTLSKCSLAIYSSDWAAQTAVDNYAVDPGKVIVVPFGPNLECNRSRKDIEVLTDNKNFDLCKLLFIGVDWHTKGGDVALAVAEQLNRRGLKTELNLVGPNPPPDLPGYVKTHGFISKKSELGRRSLEKLYSEAHFLIVPSRNECFGIVFAEASSFGLPSLATNVGGIPTAIKDGVNGWAFPAGAEADLYCDCIEKLMSSKQDYRRLALSSFNEYQTRLNWSVSGRIIENQIRERCS